MKDEIVDFVVPVDQRAPIFRLRCRVAEKGHHVVEVGDLADGDFGLDVDGLGLRFRDPAEGFQLPVVEAGGPAVALEVDGGRRDAVEGREGGDGGSPSDEQRLCQLPSARSNLYALIADKNAHLPPFLRLHIRY